MKQPDTLQTGLMFGMGRKRTSGQPSNEWSEPRSRTQKLTLRVRPINARLGPPRSSMTAAPPTGASQTVPLNHPILTQAANQGFRALRRTCGDCLWEGLVPLTGLEPVTPSLRRQGSPSRKALCYSCLGLEAFDETRPTQSGPKVGNDVFSARCLRKALWSIADRLRDPLRTH